MQDILIGFIGSGCNMEIVRNCAMTAIVYNKPETLMVILETYAAKVIPLTEMPLYEICSVLKRETCLDVLQNSRFAQPLPEVLYSIRWLIDLAKDHFTDFGAEILSCLSEVATIKQAVHARNSEGLTLLQLCFHNYKEALKPEILLKEMKVLLELGANIDAIDGNGNTILINLLHFNPTRTYMNMREAFEMLLFENPSSEVNKDAVEKALSYDAFIESRKTEPVKFSGVYTMYDEEHTLVENEIYALNFFGPLLLEAGFRSNMRTLVTAGYWNVDLNPLESNYIREYLGSPRRLVRYCRDTLRRYFKRRRLHQYIDSMNIPTKIKEYILLKYLLLKLTKIEKQLQQGKLKLQLSM